MKHRNLAMVLCSAVAGLAILGLAGRAVASSDPADFDYTIPVSITKDSTSTMVLDAAPVTMNAANLVSGGYMASDGDNVLPAGFAGTEAGALLQDLDQSAATWWVDASGLDVGDSGTWRFYLGGDASATRRFLFAGNDQILVPADLSLRFTDELGLQADLFDARYPSSPSVDSSEAMLVLPLIQGTPGTQDLSGNGNNVSTAGGSWSFNSYSYDLWFSRDYSAGDDQVSDDNTLDFADGDTIVVETAIDHDGSGSNHYVLGKGGGVGTANYEIGLNSSDNIFFTYWDGSATQTWTSSSSFGSGAGWIPFSLEYTFGTGSSLNLRVDGQDESGSWTAGSGDTAVATNAGDLHIGERAGGGLNLQGEVGYLRIWRGARTDAQRDNYAGAGLGGTTYARLIDMWTDGIGYALALSSDGELCVRIDSDEGCSAWTMADASIEAAYVIAGGADASIVVDGTVLNTFDFDEGTLGTPSIDVTIGAGDYEGFAGSLGTVEAREGDTNVSNPGNGTPVLRYTFAGDHVAQTQEGNAGNGWTWEGTVEDQSASGNDGTYTLIRDGSIWTVSLGTLLPLYSTSFPDSGRSLDDVIQGGDFGFFSAPYVETGTPGVPFMAEIADAIVGSGMEPHAGWILVFLLFGVIAVAATLALVPSWIWAFTAFAATYLFGAMLGVIQPAVIAFICIVAAGVFGFKETTQRG